MRETIEITIELIEIKNEYSLNWSIDEIESFVEYIIEQRKEYENYSVDEWFEETKMNYPELLF